MKVQEALEKGIIKREVLLTPDDFKKMNLKDFADWYYEAQREIDLDIEDIIENFSSSWVKYTMLIPLDKNEQSWGWVEFISEWDDCLPQYLNIENKEGSFSCYLEEEK